MRVLVVEDDSSLGTIIHIGLEENGYQVRTARNGHEGYIAYILFKPDVIVTDIYMPTTDGLEMMERVRTHDPHIRTIYITAEADQFSRRLEYEKRIYPVTVLEKPFSTTHLVELIAANFNDSPQPQRNRKELAALRDRA